MSCMTVVELRRMGINPRIPTMPGRNTSGFDRPGTHCLNQARSTVRCWARRMKAEPRPTGGGGAFPGVVENWAGCSFRMGVTAAHND